MTRGQYDRIGQEGKWGSAVAMTGLHGKIFARTKEGDIIWVDPARETEGQLGESGGWSSRFLMNTYNRLFTLEEDGTLFSLSPDDGTYARIGADGQWASTRACDAARGKIYTCDQDGKLYVIDPWTHQSSPFSQGKWASRLLLDAGDYLVTLEESGTFYRLDLDDGEYHQIGDKGAWGSVSAATAHNGTLFVASEGGPLQAINIFDGTHEDLGDETWSPRFFVFGEHTLFEIDEDGSLYSVAVYD